MVDGVMVDGVMMLWWMVFRAGGVEMFIYNHPNQIIPKSIRKNIE